MDVSFQTGATTANVSGVVDNNLHLIAWVSNTGLACQLGYNSRIRFYG